MPVRAYRILPATFFGPADHNGVSGGLNAASQTNRIQVFRR